MKTYCIEENDTLMEFILKHIPNRKQAKTLLKYECILVNNKPITQFNYALKKNDKVAIKTNGKSKIENIDIIYEDKHIIVVNKPAGLLTIQTEKENHTLYNMVGSYLKQQNKNAKVFVIHRLDRDTSGVVMFAKDEETKLLYQHQWNNIVLYRGYMAVIEGVLEQKDDTITILLSENNNYKTYVSKEGKEAITIYKTRMYNKNHSLLEIEIKTGRKNQIRATFEYLNHPIIGDKKYGSEDNSLKRLALHAHNLTIINPITRKEMIFKSSIPQEFIKISKKS